MKWFEDRPPRSRRRTAMVALALALLGVVGVVGAPAASAAPLPPSDLKVTGETSDSVRLSFQDNSQ